LPTIFADEPYYRAGFRRLIGLTNYSASLQRTSIF
jgi:hypothetical protein